MENKRSLFNIVDAAIILVLAAIIAGSFIRSSESSIFFGSHTPAKISYTVVIENAEREFRNMLSFGDEVYLASLEKGCGNISGIRKSPSKTYIRDDENECMIIKYDPAKVDITLTITAYVRKDKNGFFLADSQFIAPGKALKLYTGGLSFDCTVTGVSELSEN